MKEYPTYRSPIRLLRELGLNASEVHLETLKSERMRYLQLLSVSVNQEVRIGKRSLRKAEVISLFDELDSVTHIEFHERIFEHRSLLSLLEDFKILGRSENNFAMRFSSLEERDAFTEFISPFLAYSIDQLMISIIATGNFTGLAITVPFFRMLTEKDGVYAFKRLNEFCENLDQAFDAASTDATSFPIDNFIYLRYYPFYDIVNEIELFYPGITDKVATSVVNFTLKYQKHPARKDHISEISKHMKRLKCSDDIVDVINRNDRLIQSQSLRAFSPKRRKTIMITAIAVACFGALFWCVNRFGFPDLSGTTWNDPQEETTIENKPKIRPVFDYDSQVDQTGFDLNAFKLFHDSTYRRVLNKDFIKNDYIWDGTPELRSPLVIQDSMGGRPVGRIAKFKNETTSEIIMVVRDENVLNSFYAPPQSTVQVALDPNSHVFFYAGNRWNDHKTITYRHKYANIMTDGMTLRYTGSFDQTTAMDHRLLKKMYFLKLGSTFNMKIQEVDGDYVFTSKNEIVPTIQ